MSDDDWPELMSSAMAAVRLGVSRQRVTQLAQKGVLERVNGKITAESVRRRLANPPSTSRKRNPASVGTWKSRRQARLLTARRQRFEAARIAAGSEQLLSYEEVCERLSVTRRQLRNLLERGDLERVMIDSNYAAVPVESVSRYLNFL